jgi:pilus assembly protein CpaF
MPDRPGLEGVLRAVVGRVSHQFDVRNADPGSLHDQHRRQHAQQLVEQVVGQLNGEGLLNDLNPEEVVGVAVQEIVGLGALEALLSNDSVREIVVEGPRRIVADFGRGLERVNNGFFSSADAVVTVARRLIAQSGGALEAGRHVHHTALPYGPHVTVILPPVAIRGPIIEIRRMASGPAADEMIKQGVLNKEILDLVRDAISARRTIAVLGPVGAGVTTLVGALTSLFADEDRIVSAEDVPDLAIARDGVVSLGTGGAGSGVRLRDVVRQAALLRADRIVVDDLRGPDTCEVFSELAARPGGDIVGIHGQGPAGMELVRQAKLGSHGANGAAAELVARAVQLVLELERDEDGSHRVVRVTEITGSEDGEINAQELYRFDGDFSSTGAQASFRA